MTAFKVDVLCISEDDLTPIHVAMRCASPACIYPDHGQLAHYTRNSMHKMRIFTILKPLFSKKKKKKTIQDSSELTIIKTRNQFKKLIRL